MHYSPRNPNFRVIRLGPIQFELRGVHFGHLVHEPFLVKSLHSLKRHVKMGSEYWVTAAFHLGRLAK